MSKLKNTVSIYLKFGKKLKIPVNPEKIEIKYPTDHKEYDVLGLGKIVIPKKPGLKEISWECFFPSGKSEAYVNSGAKSPESYVKSMEKAMKSKQIGRIIITRSELYDTNMRCIISDFKTIDKGGETGDIYYSIALQEYRNYGPKTLSIITTSEAEQKAEVAAEEERPVETRSLRVGAPVVVNGKYWYSSYGNKPFGTANNLSTTVTRIVEGSPYPICVGSYGWVQENQLQIMG